MEQSDRIECLLQSMEHVVKEYITDKGGVALRAEIVNGLGLKHHVYPLSNPRADTAQSWLGNILLARMERRGMVTRSSGYGDIVITLKGA